MIEAPQQRGHGHVQHREFVAQHEAVLHENGRELGEALADLLTGTLHGAGGFLVVVATLQRLHVHEQLALEVEQEEARARPHDRIGRHELRVREALVDVLVDDVRLIQDQVPLDQYGHLSVGVHDRDVFGLVVQIHIADLEVHAFLEQHETAALAEGAGRA